MDTVIRVFVIYLFILIGLRILGKREFGQLSPLELVTLLIIPELVSQALVQDDFSVTNAIIAVTTLLTLVYLTSTLSHASKTFEQLVNSTPSVLVQHGQYIPDNMNKERVTPDEIFNSMHKSGLYQLEQVKWAILESDGKITIIPEDEKKAGQRQPYDEFAG